MILTLNHNGSIATLSNEFIISKFVEELSKDSSIKDSGIKETFDEMINPKFGNILHPTINYNIYSNELLAKIAAKLSDIKRKFEMGEEESLKKIRIVDVQDLIKCVELLVLSSQLPPGSGSVKLTIATV